jgi:bisanhydrobacterioruberin hydratase
MIAILKENKTHVASLILCIFYTVGIVGISTPHLRTLFLSLTPFNLLLSLVIYFWVVEHKSLKLVLLALIIASLGYLIEVIGVASGALFGQYQYGNTLGYKLVNVPLLIGINWLLLIFAAYGVMSTFFNKAWQIAFCGALLLTLLDIAIEPVAIKLDFWSWQGEKIPLQNYLMWFLVSFLLLLLVYLFRVEINGRFSFVLMGAQLVFFVMLNLLLHR